MKINKKLSLLLALAMTVSCFTACGNSATSDDEEEAAINVIVDGTEPEGSDDESAETTVGDAYYETVSQETLSSEELEAQIYDAIYGDGTSLNTGKTVEVMTSYNVDYSDRYVYSQLSDEEKALYGQIVDAAKNLQSKISIDDSVTDEMWIKVYSCVSFEEPELFWLSGNKIKTGRLYYWYDSSEADIIESRQAEIDAKVSEILSAVNGMTEYETIIYLHDYIVLNNNFEPSETSDEGQYKRTIYGGLVYGSVQCEGYAKTLMYLCDMVGIECVTIPGTNEAGGSHAWNCVKIEGEWYNIDTTWDDPQLSVVDETNLRHRYCLVPDSWIHNVSHFNVCQKTSGTTLTYFTPPTCTAETYSYFTVEGKVYDNYEDADAALKAALVEAANNKVRTAEIKVATQELYDQIVNDLSTYSKYIKAEDSSITKVGSTCDDNLLIIEICLTY